MKKKLGKMPWNGEANPRWASKKGPLTGGKKAVGIKLAAFFCTLIPPGKPIRLLSVSIFYILGFRYRFETLFYYQISGWSVGGRRGSSFL